jgi:hypothetical protein
MSDDIKLEGTPAESQPESSQNETVNEVNEEWSNLAGSSQDRFKKVIEMKNKALREKQELEEKLKSLEQRPQYVPMPQNNTSEPSFANDQERLAFERLTKDLKVVTKGDLDSLRKTLKEEVLSEAQSLTARESLDRKHAELESKFTGDYPVYDREEIEEQMQKTGIYDPQYHYEKLYRDEIIKLEARKMAGKTDKSSQPFVEKTKSRIAGTQEWTPEALSERLKQPDGREFYLKNKEKITKIYNSLWNSQ